MTVKKIRYVVLYGANGVSREFRSQSRAEDYAKRKATTMKKRTYVDSITDYKNGYSSQTTVKTVNPSKAPKRRIVRRSQSVAPKRYGGISFRLPRW